MLGSRLRYRPEIDGLRALAVLAVIIFHSETPYMSGGFIGVDIFYVISGYLITKIIISGLHQGDFSFIEFYARRIKRLLPAVFFTLLVSILFGALILTPENYVALAKSAAFSSAFLANVWFAGRTGYFDQSTEISPLAHLWSLAVEEQFYLLFPLLLFLVFKKWDFKGIRILLVCIFIVSLIMSALLSSRFPNLSFYLLHTRAWELSLGAMLVFYPISVTQGKTLSNSLSIIGFALILYGLFWISRDMQYPGLWAIYPAVGAVLIIVSAHTKGTLGHIFLTQSPIVLIGKSSYSAYLWHWPIISYYRIFVSERDFFWYETLILIITSLGVGYLSWRFIEERFRYIELSYKKLYLLAVLAISSILLLSLLVIHLNGFPDRVSEQDKAIIDRQLMWGLKCTEKIQPYPELDESYCVVGANWESASVKGIIWGDSHSIHWASLFNLLAADRGISLVIAPAKCPPYLDSDYVNTYDPKNMKHNMYCTLRNRYTTNLVNSNPEIKLIIMSTRWSGYVRKLYPGKTQDDNIPLDSFSGDTGRKLSTVALRKVISQLDLENKHLLLLSDIPSTASSLNDCAYKASSMLLRAQCIKPHTYIDASRSRDWNQFTDPILNEIASEHKNIESITLIDKLCDESKCSTYLNNEFLYMDNNHIRLNLSNSTLYELGNKTGITQYLDSL